MLNSLSVLTIFCLYMGLLFLLARWAERRAEAGRSVVKSPWIYALSLTVYCSSWTFFGSVGSAATDGMRFLSVFLGPTLVVIFWGGLMRRMVRLKSSHRITSIADFISARYAKSEALAAAVTVVALVGTVPYVSLQLKSVMATFALITSHSPDSPAWIANHVGPVVVALMIFFTIMFGVRHLDPTERHEGMVMAVAVESLVKLVAFVAAGLFVVYWLFGGMEELFHQVNQSPSLLVTVESQMQGTSLFTWAAYLIASANAILCLPRQFHITVVENQSESHIKWAMWLFPLYLLVINLFVYPLGLAGLLQGYPLDLADTFVLKLPLDHGNHLLALLVFLGGFSAATAMILICTMTLATMISNHLLLPLVDWIPQLRVIERNLLQCRWLSVGGFILLGYWFESHVGEQLRLLNIGMLSFVAVLQLGPPLLGGLLWRGGTVRGAMLGLMSGFGVWAYTLLLPTFVLSGWVSGDLLEYGPWGINFLRPHALFGLEGLDPVAHAVMWSLLFNLVLYVVGSLSQEADEQSQSQAEAFLGVASEAPIFGTSFKREPTIALADKRRRVEQLFSRYFGGRRAAALTEQALRRAGLAEKKMVSLSELVELYDMVEKSLAGAIGSATAHSALMRAELFTPFEMQELKELYAEKLAELRAPPEELKRQIDFHLEREALIQAHADELEDKLNELQRQMDMRRRAEEGLRESEERYRMAIENSYDGVVVTRNNRIIFCNQRMPHIFGYTHRRHLLGRSLGEVIHPDDRERVLHTCLRRQDGEMVPSRYDFKGLKRDGSFIYIAVSATSINYQGERMNLVYLRDVTRRRQTEEEIRHLSRRLIAGIEEERRRLAADLHDEFGQSLTALHLWMESLRKSLGGGREEDRTSCERLTGQIEQMADNLRKICSELRPDMLDHLGLVSTLESYVQDFGQRLSGVNVEFEAVGFMERRLGPELEITLYRILQEALNNVAKHAQARRVSVMLTYNHPQVIMVISDDGRGFAPERDLPQEGYSQRGIGLTSMKERAASVGGVLDVRSVPGRGAMVRVVLPAG